MRLERIVIVACLVAAIAVGVAASGGRPADLRAKSLTILNDDGEMVGGFDSHGDGAILSVLGAKGHASFSVACDGESKSRFCLSSDGGKNGIQMTSTGNGLGFALYNPAGTANVSVVCDRAGADPKIAIKDAKNKVIWSAP